MHNWYKTYIEVNTVCRHLLGTMQFLALPLQGVGRTQMPGPVKKGLEEVDIVGNISGGLVVALPLKCCHRIKLQLEK